MRVWRRLRLFYRQGDFRVQGLLFVVGLIAAWLAQSPGQEGQDEARDAGKEEGQSPATGIETGQRAAQDEAEQDAHVLTRTPQAHDARASGAAKIIAHEGGTGGKIARLTDAQHHAGEEQRGEVI